MNESFYTQTKCDRCGGSLQEGRTMSMYNTECICLKCKAEEKQRPDYHRALEAVREAEKNGNRNFQGVGLKEGDQNDIL